MASIIKKIYSFRKKLSNVCTQSCRKIYHTPGELLFSLILNGKPRLKGKQKGPSHTIAFFPISFPKQSQTICWIYEPILPVSWLYTASWSLISLLHEVFDCFTECYTCIRCCYHTLYIYLACAIQVCCMFLVDFEPKSALEYITNIPKSSEISSKDAYAVIFLALADTTTYILKCCLEINVSTWTMSHLQEM